MTESSAIAHLVSISSMDIRVGAAHFRWLSTSFDSEKVRRLTYCCLACASDFKGTPEELGRLLPTHADISCESGN